jgi:hypothetical protein
MEDKSMRSSLYPRINGRIHFISVHILKVLVLMIFLYGKASTDSLGQTTLYSYKSGSWNDIDTWTTDPGGTTLVGSQVPTNGDIVVILTSRTVTLPGNIATTGLDVTINSGGILDLGNYQFTSTLAALRGQGTLQLSSANFPSVTLNTFVNSGGGTTEYKNTASFDLPVAQTTYNNLQINLTNSSFIVTQLNNLTLNGDLEVISGNYRINNGTVARRQLTIYGDVTVSSWSSITVGTGNTATITVPTGITGGTAPFVNYYDQNTHRVVIHGDFTNNGTVKFTNQSYPEYAVFPTNGAASVFFQGASDNTLTCNYTTDFYNLIVDKGTDQTFVLSLNSAGYNYFRLFGANISGGEGGGDNPILKKALWIRNGTLRLYGLVVIPSLSEGTCDGGLSGGPNSDFYVPANGALVIDGPDVVVLTTADSYREINAAYGTTAANDGQVGVSTGGCSSFSLLGKFQIDDGYVSTRESGGFIYWATTSGQFIINGGSLDAKQFRTANSAGGLTAYRQTGGTLTLRGRFQRNVTGVTDVASLKSVALNTTRAGNGINGNVGTFNIDQDANIFEMTGGTIEVLDVCGIDGSNIGRAFEVNSLPTYQNVTGGSVIINPTTGSGTDYTYYFASAAPVGTFTITQTSGTQQVRLTNIVAKSGVTARNPSLNVLGNITITGNNAVLNASGYDVLTGGNFSLPANTTYTPGANTSTFSGSGNNTFTYNGTISGGLNNLVIDKTGGSLTVARTTPNTTNIAGYFSLLGGTFTDGGNTFNVYGNVINSGTHAGTGLIALVGTNTQTIGGDGNGIFQNLTLNNTNGAAAPLSLTAGITINGTLTLTSNKIFNIGSYNLNLTSTGSLSGTFGANRFIATNGDIGDKGITKTFSSNSFTFPIGVIPTSVRYTPVIVTLSATPTTYGSITVFPVDAEQMQTSPSGKNRSLTYFWRESSSGFVLGTATITQKFYYSTNDVTLGGGITEDEYSPARYNPATFSWNKGTAADVDETNNIINWPNNVNYIDGDYTAGDDNPAAQDPFGPVTVYYSSGGGTGFWNNRASWVTDTVTMVNGPNSFPDQNTPAVIRNGHTITIDNNNRRSGNLRIQATGVLDCMAYTGLNFGVVTNPANGSGKIRISIPSANPTNQITAAFPSGDFSEFRGLNGGTVEYYTGAIDEMLIPSTSQSGDALNYYRHIILTPEIGRYIAMPDLNLTIYGNMTVQGTGTTRFNTTASRTMEIDGNLSVTSGTLQFRDGQSQTINVDGNISISSGATFNVQNNGATTNSLNINGNLTNNGTLEFRYAPATSSCDITFIGSTNASLTGTGNTTLRNLIVNKGSSQITTLTVDVSGATFSTLTDNWLTLSNGTLRFMRTGNLNISTTSNFTIPSTAGLYVDNASANVNIANNGVNNNDMYLNGKLTILNGNIYVGPSAAPNFNNDIEYSGSGDSEIDIRGGSLTVNGQIRRSSIVTGGVLVYNQSNGAVTINGNNALATRAKFEVDNPGSVFNMSGGTLMVLRGGGTTYGDLFLRPASGSITGGTLLLGTQNVGAQTIRFDAGLPLYNLTLDGVGAANTFQLMVNPLELNGNLLINTANSTFNASSLAVSIAGNFTNNGTYTPGTNTTTMNGVTQIINGTTSTSFYDLVIAPATSVTLSNSITVNNDIALSSGTFATGTYDVNIKGDLTNNAVHTGDNSTGGLLLNGTSLQLIAGSGTFGRLEVNNAAGARLQNNISLLQDLLLTNGILNINQYLLTLGQNSDIVGSGFGINKMIMPDGVFSNIGIKKYFAAGANTFTYPLGVAGKYTPADLTITSNSTGGNIRINVINDRHPAVSDPNNVLQYYWEAESSTLSGFEGNLALNYSNSDVMGAENNYVAARLIVPPGTDWSKAATGPTTDNVDEVQNIITFNFPAGTTSLGGEYTAGTDAAIPDEVPVYTSNGDGDWDDVNKWTPVAPAGGPNGFIVIIRAGDVISTNGNRRFAYRTTIDGQLDVGATYGHNLGSIDGNGTLYMESPTLPAGRLTSFLNCSGGTLEYGGNTNYTLIADRIDTVRNLFFTGTGNRIMPDKDLVICDTLKIDGPSLKNNTYNRMITLFGTIQRLNTGTFTSGSGPDATVVFAGPSGQTIGGANGNFNGSNALNNLEINNGNGLVLNGLLEINGNLLLTDGIITSTAANKFVMLNGNAVVTPTGGASSSFVSGPISKRIFGGNDFEFPTGKSTRYGKTVVIGVSDGTWESEYFNTGYSITAVTSPLISVSSSEYWHVKGPAGKQAYVKLRWDPLSDVTPLTTQSGISDIRVAEYSSGSSTWVAQNTTASGDNFNGTAQTNDKMNLDEHDYTLGSISTLKPRASFASTAAICVGDNLSVVFSKSAASYSFTYNINGGSNQNVTTSSNPYTFATASAGRYRLTGFTGGVVDTNSVLVRPVPTATLTSSDADNQICAGQSVTFTAGGGSQYSFYVNSSVVQSGVSSIYITTALVNGDNVHAVVTNSSGCSAASSTLTMTVNPIPSVTITGSIQVCEETTTTLDAGAGFSSYAWSFGAINLGSAQTQVVTAQSLVAPTNNATETYTVVVTSAAGCSGSDTHTIDVYRLPDTGPNYYVPNNNNQ